MLTRIRLTLATIILALLGAAGPAHARVEVSFYSKEFGDSFPHAFVQVKGVLDRTGQSVDESYGFTATRVSPAVLMGSVKGEIIASAPAYILKSHHHFSFAIGDEDYDRLLATVEKWRGFKQPSYNLNKRNCVFFVADIAQALGMTAETPPALMKKPYSYLLSLTRDNRAWLENRSARIAPCRRDCVAPTP